MTIRITALNPELVYQAGMSNLTDPDPISPQDQTSCCEFSGPVVVGDSAAVITITSGSPDPVSGIVIRAEWCDGGYSDTYADAYADITEGGTYPDARVTDTEYTIQDMPANSILTIDASQRRVTLLDAAGRVQAHDVSVLDWEGLFEWIEAAKGGCQRICVDAGGATLNADTTAAITVIDREV